MDPNKPLIAHLPDEEVLFSLMGLYYDDIFRYGIKFTGDADETKDAINQFFIHFWDNRDKLGKVENLKAYLFVSFRRWLITRLQQSKKHYQVTLDDNLNNELVEQSYEEYLIGQVSNEELGLVLKNAIATLPVRQRKLLQLRFYEHLGFEEIAEKTSLSVRTIYNKLHEAIKKLRSNSSIQKLR